MTCRVNDFSRDGCLFPSTRTSETNFLEKGCHYQKRFLCFLPNTKHIYLPSSLVYSTRNFHRIEQLIYRRLLLESLLMRFQHVLSIMMKMKLCISVYLQKKLIAYLADQLKRGGANLLQSPGCIGRLLIFGFCPLASEGFIPRY